MAKYRIAWLPGDGIGKEVMEAAKLVLDHMDLSAEYLPGDIGWEFWKKEGNPLPDRTKILLKNSDCCLLGAITSKPKDEAEKELEANLRNRDFVYNSPIVQIRQELNLQLNIRPCKSYEGNPLNFRNDIDLVIFRENTEGMYSGVEYHPVPVELREMLKRHNAKMSRFDSVMERDMAISLRITTRKACQTIARHAFEYARKMGRHKVTVVEKPNVLRETSGMMISECRKVANEYPGIDLEEANIDAMAMWLVKSPQKYDVLVLTNLFGDIISDLCAQLVGGLGFSPSANIGDNYAVFEPTHGSAPKYAGMYKMNPVAMLLTVKMMLDYLGEVTSATQLEQAITKVIKEGKVRTYDMGGNSSTLQVAREVIRFLDGSA